jgi:hypothetical protein
MRRRIEHKGETNGGGTRVESEDNKENDILEMDTDRKRILKHQL